MCGGGIGKKKKIVRIVGEVGREEAIENEGNMVFCPVDQELLGDYHLIQNCAQSF